ncbi:MAG: spore germination protein [Epulopiscium sp.]|nr:spore germination protein [Candidatus Epulonipiscium sp.]
MLQSQKKSLYSSLKQNIEMIKEIFLHDDTLICRQFENQRDPNVQCCIFYIDGMVDDPTVNRNIILPIIRNPLLKKESNILHYLQYQVIPSNDIKETQDLNQLTSAIICGDTILFVNGFSKALIMNTKGWKTRSITEPVSERVLRGPREGFTESLITNLSMVRRKIQTTNLKFEFLSFGEQTHTKACICYIDGIVNPKILDELHKRLKNFDLDGALGISYIREFIKDHPLSPFKTIGSTERPDVVAGKILEGRIALLLDGTPVVITLPYLFIEYFQSNEDYYINFYFASIGRILRILGFIITTSIPAIYLAFITFHQELIPTPLILSISAARQDVPFPTILELVILLTTFEILREAGTRMPTYIGQALSIVGALVLGQAAVEAKIVSAPIVIILAITGITGLMIPNLTSVSILCRASLLFLSAILGLYGYIFGISTWMIHLFSIHSFGVPFMQTLNSLHPQDLKDTAIRAPWWYMKYRPHLITFNRRRKFPGGPNDE